MGAISTPRMRHRKAGQDDCVPPLAAEALALPVAAGAPLMASARGENTSDWAAEEAGAPKLVRVPKREDIARADERHAGEGPFLNETRSSAA